MKDCRQAFLKRGPFVLNVILVGSECLSVQSRSFNLNDSVKHKFSNHKLNVFLDSVDMFFRLEFCGRFFNI